MVLVPGCHGELMHQIQQTWMVALGSAYEAFGVRTYVTNALMLPSLKGKHFQRSKG
jgi:hypothetical protein